jgi:anti-sigma factor RsiW
LIREAHDRGDDVAAYALGALSELEAAAFERHLMQCDVCAAELDRLRPVVDALPLSARQVEAPPSLKRAVMGEVRSQSADAGRRTWLPRARWSPSGMRFRPRLALAGTLAAAALVLGAYGLGASLSDEESQLTRATVDSARVPGASATLSFQDELGVLRASGLPELGRGQVYVVWLDRGGAPVYSSSFNVRPDGTGEAGVPDLDGVERLMVTREPSAAVSKPSEPPVLTVELS